MTKKEQLIEELMAEVGAAFDKINAAPITEEVKDLAKLDFALKLMLVVRRKKEDR